MQVLVGKSPLNGPCSIAMFDYLYQKTWESHQGNTVTIGDYTIMCLKTGIQIQGVYSQFLTQSRLDLGLPILGAFGQKPAAS